MPVEAKTEAGAAEAVDAALDPSHIIEVGLGFWASKTLLSAVELELFTQLGGKELTAAEVGERLGLHPRGIYDFLDTLLALGFLERDGTGSDSRYRNTAQTTTFLNKRSPTYVGAGSWGCVTRGCIASGAI
jgi:hypothetical protein